MTVTYKSYFVFFITALMVIPALWFLFYTHRENISDFNQIETLPTIKPDYSGAAIPPNIAPLNFSVLENGSDYYVKLYSQTKTNLEIESKSGKVTIPANLWHTLLNENRGRQLYIDVYVKRDKWNKYQRIACTIANEDIDPYIAYRKMNYTTTHHNGTMGIYQRDLRNFDEKVILKNENFGDGCVNCHSFCGNNPDKMLLGIRSYDSYGISTLFIDNGKVEKIRAKFGYTAWHPSGKLSLYSINDLPMFWHQAGKEVRDTVNLDSSLAYFLTGIRQIKTVKEISRKEQLENWPVWSADGNYLYFATALKPKNASQESMTGLKYDLVRIAYDINKDKWGEVQNVLSAQDTGKSIAMPRTSPDGRWLSFCMIDSGYFPCWHTESDLYIMDLNSAPQNGKFDYKKIDISSSESESWQSWSSNSRWLVFSSKRDYGVFTRTYISYVDADGKVYKPIVLPQKDPDFYDSCLWIYTVPELIKKPVLVTGEKLARVVRGSEQIITDMPVTTATPKIDKL
jgi:hypothetical protein